MRDNEWRKSSWVAGLPGLTARNRRAGRNPEVVGPAQAWQAGTGLLQLWRRLTEVYELEIRDLTRSDNHYLLLKAQRLAATKTKFVAFQKAA